MGDPEVKDPLWFKLILMVLYVPVMALIGTYRLFHNPIAAMVGRALQ